MSQWLKQSTAATIPMGPFVDSTDGVTPETALSLTQAETRLSKNGAAFAQKNDAATGTHGEEGNYLVTLDATDTNTLGRLRVSIYVAGALPVWQDFMIVPANVWDSMFGADKLQVDAVEVTGTAQTARDLGAQLDAAVSTRSSHTAADVWTSGTRTLTAFDAAFKTGYSLSAAGVQAIWDALTSALTTVGSIGKLIVDNLNATVSSRSSHSAADVWAVGTRTITGTGAGALTSSSFGAGAIDAAAVAADTGNELADALLDRNMGTGTDSGSATVRTVRQALRALRNRAAIAAGTLTIYKEDDTTASWTGAVTTTAGNPISEVNPADA